MQARESAVFSRRAALVLPAVAVVALAGCSSSKEADNKVGGNTAPIKVEDAWIKAADEGMTGMFAKLSIHGAEATSVTLESASTRVAEKCELHEVVTVDGSSVMREKKGGFTVEAGKDFMLEPGGYHIMLMGLKGPLVAGDNVAVHLVFKGYDPVSVNAVVKDFTGAQEDYGDLEHGGASDAGHAGHEDHSGHSGH